MQHGYADTCRLSVRQRQIGAAGLAQQSREVSQPAQTFPCVPCAMYAEIKRQHTA